MSDEQESGGEAEPNVEPGADIEPARDVSGRFADAKAARVAAARRWHPERVSSTGLDTPDSIRQALRRLAKAGLGEVRRLRRANKPIPPVLISSISRPLERLLDDAVSQSEIERLREMAADLKAQQQRPRRRA